jgi:hypothetical protein
LPVGRIPLIMISFAIRIPPIHSRILYIFGCQ